MGMKLTKDFLSGRDATPFKLVSLDDGWSGPPCLDLGGKAGGGMTWGDGSEFERINFCCHCLAISTGMSGRAPLWKLYWFLAVSYKKLWSFIFLKIYQLKWNLWLWSMKIFRCKKICWITIGRIHHSSKFFIQNHYSSIYYFTKYILFVDSRAFFYC